MTQSKLSLRGPGGVLPPGGGGGSRGGVQWPGHGKASGGDGRDFGYVGSVGTGGRARREVFGGVASVRMRNRVFAVRRRVSGLKGNFQARYSLLSGKNPVSFPVNL